MQLGKLDVYQVFQGLSAKLRSSKLNNIKGLTDQRQIANQSLGAGAIVFAVVSPVLAQIGA
jgi:hypothetical protein